MRRFAIVQRLARMGRVLTSLCGGFSYGTAVIGEPITSASAIAAVQARMKTRQAVFLDTVERAIFANSSSPYRRLLDAAGYDLARFRTLVLAHGVEAALSQLAHDGVYVSIEEFKGFHEARRGGRTFRFSERDFHNPFARGGFRMLSGGTRSAGIPTTVSASTFRMHAQHMAVAVAANGLEGLPVVLWAHQLEPLSLSMLMIFAAMRQVPKRLFTQIPGWRLASVDLSHSYYVGIDLAARVRGLGFPPRTYVPFGQESIALPLILQLTGRNGCVVRTSAGTALRLALEAKRTGTRLTNVTFIAGGESLTPAKLAAIEAAGARARSMFSFSEFGTAAYGCASPARPDDMHVCKDAVAVIQRRRPADQIGSEVDALLFTSLQPSARRILLNMETGDYADIVHRRCGCFLERIGWTEHVVDIRSFEKLNLENWAFLGSKLNTLVEELLPERFGGDPTDYQLLENEDREGHTRLTILVHPRRGTIDETAVLECVEDVLGVPPSWVEARVYRRLETLQLRRAAPIMTRSGKLLPLVRIGSRQAAGPRGPASV